MLIKVMVERQLLGDVFSGNDGIEVIRVTERGAT